MTDCVVFSCHVSYEVEDYDILYDGKRNLIWLCPGLLQCHGFSDATYVLIVLIVPPRQYLEKDFPQVFVPWICIQRFKSFLTLI